MGKIVKFCAGCDESFAEKFAFCPNCGQAMTAFEMNPLAAAAETHISDALTANVENDKTAEYEAKSDIPIYAPALTEDASNVEIPESAETRKFFTVHPVKASVDNAVSDESFASGAITPEDDFAPEPQIFAATAGTNGNGNYNQTNAADFQTDFINREKPVDDGYRITVIEEKNVNQRNGLLLATMVLMVSIVLGATVFSLFNKDFLVSAIDQGDPLYVTAIEDVPPPIEVQPPKVKNDKDGGGGGGGGKEEKEPASKGRLVSQSENPITPPSVNIPQLRNPSLPVIMETKGNIKRPITEERPGLPGSDNLNPSNGTGRGGGIGSGQGTGIGGGIGTGEGNGNGSGSGNGNGNGNGNGTGDGSGNPKPPPPLPPKPAGITQDIKIISKPGAKYTDLARQNSFSGTVRLRVTFTANGQIGSISPVSSLPYGLVEQAIAAAKAIKFEPAKKDGVPFTKVKQIDYSFTLY